MLTADDFVTGSEADLYRWASGWMRDRRCYGNLKSYGRNALNIGRESNIEVVTNPADLVENARLLMAQAKFVTYLVANYKQIVLDLIASGQQSIEVKHAGLSTMLFADYATGSFTCDAIQREFHHVIKPWVNDMGEVQDGYYKVHDPVTPSFVGVLAEVYAEARKKQIKEAMNQSPTGLYAVDSRFRIPHDGISVASLLTIKNTAAFLQEYKVKLSLEEVSDARRELLRRAAQEADQRRFEKMRKSSDSFTQYWSRMKQAVQRNADWAEARESFRKIEVLPAGTESSRTWGIEVETVRADLVSRPRGWESRYDGSLESMGYDSDCDCECSDCYDGYHDDCGGSDSGCAEFVSPVLRSYNSDGLRALCGPLEKVDHNTSPGIHVHVGADNLTAFDVARLLRAYSIVSPYIQGINYREVTGYCKDVTSSNIAYWLSAVRKVARGDMTHPYDDRVRLDEMSIKDIASAQPDDRYHDINLQSLSAHGTIEFRVMGPHYNYEHLVRWAWFCREMVNVSQLDLPDSVWTSCRSMADVIAVLKQYGVEYPSDTHDKATVKLATKLNASYLADVDA